MVEEMETVPLVGQNMSRGPGVSADDYVPPGISREEYERLRKRYLGSTAGDVFQQVLWILAAVAVAYFGNGKDDLVTIMLRDERVVRWARNGWAACFLINVGIYIYVSWVLWAVKRRSVDYEEVPWSIPTATVAGLASMVFFCIALWFVFHVLVLPIFFVLFMGFFMVIAAIPSPGSSKID